MCVCGASPWGNSSLTSCEITSFVCGGRVPPQPSKIKWISLSTETGFRYVFIYKLSAASFISPERNTELLHSSLEISCSDQSYVSISNSYVCVGKPNVSQSLLTFHIFIFLSLWLAFAFLSGFKYFTLNEKCLHTFLHWTFIEA